MKIITIPVGLLETNCYLVQPESSRTLYVIDPGAAGESIASRVSECGCSRVAVLLTHAHVDHISGLGAFCGAVHPAYVYLRYPDHALYESPKNALPPCLPAAKDLPGVVGSADDPDFKVIPLPGHTPGGSGFLFQGDPPVLFVGDTIFAGSIGRTDFPGGNCEILLEAIRTQLLTLPDAVELYPGHGPSTTVGRERKYNPYLVECRQ